jgi:hypothetical protein
MDTAREQMDQVEEDHLRVVDSIEEHVLDLEYRAEVLKEVFFDKVSGTRATTRSKSVRKPPQQPGRPPRSRGFDTAECQSYSSFRESKLRNLVISVTVSSCRYTLESLGMLLIFDNHMVSRS